MSCAKTSLLEALVANEVGPAEARELRAHAAGCACCKHELRWLESEVALFRQRAGRDEVAHLWAGIEQRTELAPPPPAWARGLLTLAAAAVVVLSVSQLWPGARPVTSDPEAGESMSVDGTLLTSQEICSHAEGGELGFHCGAALPDDVLASR
jgi:anti-sigma factor RsiW